MIETTTTFCRICEALCGLEADVESGPDGVKVLALRPDPKHVVTEGFACIKGLRQHEMYASPDRLTKPRIRVRDGNYRDASWGESLASIGAKVRQLKSDHGPDSIAMYVGTAAGFSVLHPVFAQGFMQGIGSRSIYATATQDCANKFSVARDVYGFPFTQPFPDLDHTDCLVVVGGNPAVSKWSFGQVSNPVARLKAIERRGGRVFVVDPRRTETAQAAGTHTFIRPGTDVFFFASFLNVLIEMDAVDQQVVTQHTSGFDAAATAVEPWPPERTASVTGVAANDLRSIVTAFAAAKGAALYSSTGVNMGGEGALSFWLQEVINAVSGNLDRKGGTIVGRGIVDFPKFAHKHGILMGSDRSRIGDIGMVNDALPGGVLADEILTPGPGQVKALFVTGGNPLLTMPNSARLREAFKSLELLVVLDIVQSETASVATHVLPCTSALERPDLPFLFPLFLGMQTQPYLQATRALIPPSGEQRDESSIYLELAKAAGAPMFGSRIAQRALETLRSANGGALPQEKLLSLLSRLGGQGSFSKLAAESHGRMLAKHRPGDYLGQRVLNDDGRVHLGPARLLSAFESRAERLFASEKEAIVAGGLRLITKRAVASHNSWTHNHPKMVAGKRHTNYLYMHPKDAADRKLADGALADVSTPTGTVRLPISLLESLMPGTVALPHGWGHQAAKGLSVASRTAGVNVNLLAADGPDALDPLSGMARLTAIDVTVTQAAGPQDVTNWAGIR